LRSFVLGCRNVYRLGQVRDAPRLGVSCGSPVNVSVTPPPVPDRGGWTGNARCTGWAHLPVAGPAADVRRPPPSALRDHRSDGLDRGGPHRQNRASSSLAGKGSS